MREDWIRQTLLFFHILRGLWHTVVAYEQGPRLGWTAAKSGVRQGRYSRRRRSVSGREREERRRGRPPAASCSFAPAPSLLLLLLVGRGSQLLLKTKQRGGGRCSSNSNRSGHVVLRRHSTKSQSALPVSLIFQPMAASLMKKALWVRTRQRRLQCFLPRMLS